MGEVKGWTYLLCLEPIWVEMRIGNLFNCLLPLDTDVLSFQLIKDGILPMACTLHQMVSLVALLILTLSLIIAYLITSLPWEGTLLSKGILRTHRIQTIPQGLPLTIMVSTMSELYLLRWLLIPITLTLHTLLHLTNRLPDITINLAYFRIPWVP